MVALWSAGDAYDGYMGRWSGRIAPRFLDWAGVVGGGAALDVGCGTGALSRALLAHGAGRVVGVDPSAPFVDAARRLAPGGMFETGDAQALRFADGAFDAVVSGLVLNFVPDPALAVREMRRVAREGGVVAAYVWDYVDGMEMLRRFWDAAMALDDAARARRGETRFALCAEEPLAALFDGAGLRQVATTRIEETAAFRDFDDFWRPFLGGQGPAAGHVAALAPSAREALRERLRATLPTRPDGSIRLRLCAFAVRGTR